MCITGVLNYFFAIENIDILIYLLFYMFYLFKIIFGINLWGKCITIRLPSAQRLNDGFPHRLGVSDRCQVGGAVHQDSAAARQHAIHDVQSGRSGRSGENQSDQQNIAKARWLAHD